MRPGGGHSKGAAFERAVCRDLSLWLTAGQHDDLLWRSAMSGGRATVRFKKGRASRSQAGDISPISGVGEKLTDLFLLECKHYRDLQMIGLYLGLTTGIHKHWKETVEDAQRHKKWPMLIAKQSRTPTFVLLDQRGLDFCDLQNHVIAHFPELDVYVLWYGAFLKEAKRP